MRNYCTNETWTISDLIDAYDPIPNKKRKIQVYRRQRSIVWNEEKKKRLIKSIKSGFPIGSVLLYKYKDTVSGKDGNNLTTYLIVDGLQRSSTILDYNRNPTSYFEKYNLDDLKINEIIYILKKEVSGDALLKVNVESVKDMLSQYIKKVTGFAETEGYSSFDVASYLAEQFNITSYDVIKNITNILKIMLKKIKDDADISNAEIPIIIYNGEAINLPDIFYNLNKEGTTLSKYDVYSATWSKDNLIKIKNTDIVDNIKEKYIVLAEEGLEVQDFDEDEEDFYKIEFSTFEYIFGLGKYITQKYSIFSTGELGNVDSIIFNLCSLCLLGDIQKMESLPQKIASIDQEKFESALNDAINIVYTSIKPFIELNLNKKKSRNKNSKKDEFLYHNEYQIVSFIAKVFKAKYDDNLDLRDDWNDNCNLIQNIPSYYLYDILRDHWSGTGDSKAKNYVIGNRYEKSIAKNEWNSVLDIWFKDQLDRKETKRVSLKDKELLFLKYIYAHKLSSFDENSLKEFQLDHIISVDNLKENAKNLGEGLPISCVSNLGLIDSDINNKKKTLDIYEYVDQLTLSKKISNDEAKELISKCEKYMIIEKTEFDKFHLNSKVSFKDAYTNLLKDRFVTLKEEFFKLNNIK